RWLRGTRFGRAVVPEVSSTKAMSSPLRRSGAGTAGRGASSLMAPAGPAGVLSNVIAGNPPRRATAREGEPRGGGGAGGGGEGVERRGREDGLELGRGCPGIQGYADRGGRHREERH